MAPFLAGACLAVAAGRQRTQRSPAPCLIQRVPPLFTLLRFPSRAGRLNFRKMRLRPVGWAMCGEFSGGFAGKYNRSRYAVLFNLSIRPERSI